MSYVIQAVLSNPRRPECDQITIPFPIPVDQYDKTIEMLQAIDLGFSVNRDCTVDEVNSRYSVLNTLVCLSSCVWHEIALWSREPTIP